MTTVLMLAFEFPPATSIGMRRSLMLARLLPEHGVRPVVVTTDADSLELWHRRPLDASPLHRLPGDVKIHRIACPFPFIPSGRWQRRLRRLSVVGDEDTGRHWEAPLSAAWDRMITETTPAAIYVSLPPFSIAVVAARLAARSNIPLVVDFRDNWSQWAHSLHPTWWHYRHTLAEERRCVEQAAAVVTTTAQIAADLQAVHPSIDRSKFHVVPTGFEGALPVAVDRTIADGPFVIGYVGSFYYIPEQRTSMLSPWWQRSPQHWLGYAPRHEDWLYRTPHFFFAALARLLKARPELRARVRVRFAGDREAWLDEQIRSFGLEDVVEHAGRLSHADSLAFQRGCDALLSTSAKVIGGRDPYIAGKTFEYLLAGRPVVAFVAEGEQRDLWQRSGVAAVCDPDDEAESARRLGTVLTGGFQPRPDRAFLDQFRSSESARQMATLLNGIHGH
jgi:glycosyltransferase involved in cell wall biosynthesis